jgi:hypothetical protein
LGNKAYDLKKRNKNKIPTNKREIITAELAKTGIENAIITIKGSKKIPITLLNKKTINT